LTPDARLRAMANFDRLLAIDGRLCVTPAEADRLPPGRFVAEGSAEFGIYRRVGVGSSLHIVPALFTETAAEAPIHTTPAPVASKVPVQPGTIEAARFLA